MELSGSDVLAIAIAALVHYVAGAVWYAIFGRAWLPLTRLSPARIQTMGMLPYAIAGISSLVVSAVILLILRQASIDTVAGGLWFGFLLGAGIAGTTSALHYGFEGRPLKLYLIDAGYSTVGIMLVSAILASW